MAILGGQAYYGILYYKLEFTYGYQVWEIFFSRNFFLKFLGNFLEFLGQVGIGQTPLGSTNLGMLGLGFDNRHYLGLGLSTLINFCNYREYYSHSDSSNMQCFLALVSFRITYNSSYSVPLLASQQCTFFLTTITDQKKTGKILPLQYKLFPVIPYLRKTRVNFNSIPLLLKIKKGLLMENVAQFVYCY